MEDHFIREHIEDLLRNIRTQVLVRLIRPYTRVRITFIAQVSFDPLSTPTLNQAGYDIIMCIHELACIMGTRHMQTDIFVPVYKSL
jgi:hypothetical protein